MLQADQGNDDSPIKGNRQPIPIEQNFVQEESEDEDLQNSASPQKLTNKLSKGNLNNQGPLSQALSQRSARG